MSRKRGERSEKTEVEDIKIAKRRLRSLERENQRLRKELRKRLSLEVLDDEVLEADWSNRNSVPEPETPKCECGSDRTKVLEIPLRTEVRKYLMCECGKRKRIE